MVDPGGFLARARTCGTPGRVRAAAEPGLRLPLADGPVLPARLAARPARAGSCSGCGGRWCCAWRSSGAARLARALGVALRPLRLGRVRLRAVAADAHRRSGRSRSRPGRVRWRPGCCCRSSSGRERGSPAGRRRCRALAVATVGGVNAAATFAVLPLGVVWVLTRTPGPRRRALMIWWPVFTLLGTLWWLVPLFVLGPTARRSSTSSRRRPSPRSRPPSSTPCAARRTGSRTSTAVPRGQRPDPAVLPGAQQRDRAVLRSRRPAISGATRTGCSSASASLTGLLLVTMGHIGGVHGLGGRRPAVPARRPAGPAAQRAQVRPR